MATHISPTRPSGAIAAALSARRVGSDDDADLPDRRSALIGAAVSVLLPLPALAEDGGAPPAAATTEPYTRRGKDFSYDFVPPAGFDAGNKPLKTHLDEINFSKEGVRGYQYGITVDPVRIDSLRQFGTPEEVAARVVTAEVNRDGIFEVTLAKDPAEDAALGSYLFEYVSDGKRGKKRFLTKIYVRNQKLYVLTAQSKEEEYTAEREREMAEVAGTFRLL